MMSFKPAYIKAQEAAALSYKNNGPSHVAMNSGSLHINDLVGKDEREFAAQNISEAIQFKTISNQNSKDNDWEQWRNFHNWLNNRFPLMHSQTKLTKVDEFSLIYEWQGSDRNLEPIILMGHHDVVPVEKGTEADWKHGPFSGAIADGAIWGRGAVDDKGPLIAIMSSIESAIQKGFAPKRTIYIVSTHDEEVFGGGAKAVVKWMQAKKIKALFTLDEGSGIISNAPLTNEAAAMIGISEKGYGTMSITARAEGGHSSMPGKDMAVVILARAMAAIDKNQFPLALSGPAKDLIESLAYEKGGAIKFAIGNMWLTAPIVKREIAKSNAGAAMLHTTMAPTMLQAAPKENIIPQSASAKINFRIAPGQSSEEVMAWVKNSTEGMNVEIKWTSSPKEASAISSTSSAGWNLINSAVGIIDKNLLVAPSLVLAGTDAYNFYAVSNDVYRFYPIKEPIDGFAMVHGTNEHLKLHNLDNMLKFYTYLIYSAGGDEKILNN
ncbi:hypothetical protein LPB140_07890 [Sphingorhabdus lutea]|uniref:Peptidase M20 dimerisation domain-containing protein n=2 Tax=Sphingorhabdus lutea TaxID=1913578 RepID=A0A1L3JEX6_9SPHN|nr:hypothetical protein LPB140_07890 [Sphingorhabdus lutea]